MKKLVFIFAISALGIFNSTAQPNGGFEFWTPQFSYENPDGWETLNFMSLLNPPNPLSAFKAVGFDKHSGNYSLMLKTVYIQNRPPFGDITIDSLIGDSAGAAFTGTIYLSPVSYKIGFPYTGRPEKLEFWSKYAPVGSDVGSGAVFLKKWNGISSDTIAFGLAVISSTPIYTKFEVILEYKLSSIPDSALIVFASSMSNTTARLNSALYVDDVEFTGWVGVEEESDLYADKIKIFPNPAKDNLTITAEIEEAENIRIIDVSGKIVGESKIQKSHANIKTDLFAEGIYFYQVLNNREGVLAKGKFNVIK
ncbi:MAG: T9SS type A sorting domain-containing protein [Bacteroidota bacterium]